MSNFEQLKSAFHTVATFMSWPREIRELCVSLSTDGRVKERKIRKKKRTRKHWSAEEKAELHNCFEKNGFTRAYAKKLAGVYNCSVSGIVSQYGVWNKAKGKNK